MNTELSLTYILQAVRSGYRWLLVSMAVCLLVAGIYLRVAQRQYEAILIVAPPLLSLQGQGLGLSSGQSLVSTFLGGAPQTPRYFGRFVTLITSDFVANALLADDRVKLALYPDQWSAASQQWHPPRSVFSALVRSVKSALGFAGWLPPDARSLADYLRKNVTVTSETKTDLFEISYRNKDKSFAVYLLAAAYKLVDQKLKKEAIEEHDTNANYLSHILTTTTNAEMRAAITRLYVDELRQRMLDAVDAPFTADIVDGPSVGDAPVKPSMPIALGTAIFLGIAFGVFLAVVAHRRSAMVPVRPVDSSAFPEPNRNMPSAHRSGKLT